MLTSAPGDASLTNFSSFVALKVAWRDEGKGWSLFLGATSYNLLNAPPGGMGLADQART